MLTTYAISCDNLVNKMNWSVMTQEASALCVYSLFFGGIFMSNIDKPFKTIDEQLKILQKRNLIFLNEEADKKKLRDYGYYEIINGYKPHFLKDSTDDEQGYKNGINFQHVFDLYDLDKKIRNDVRSSLEDFEQSFKQNLAYVISRDISEDQNRYTKKSHYNTGKTHHYKKRNGQKYILNDRDRLLKQFNNILTSDYDPYKYYKEKHNNIPPWILVKGLTFGNTIYWFRLSKPNIRKEVIARMLNLDVKILETVNEQLGITRAFSDVLNLYLHYRNLSSHSGRIYDHRSQKYQIRNYSTFIYQSNKVIFETSKEFSKGTLRSSIGTVLRTLNMFSNEDPYLYLMVNLEIDISGYLKKYPDDFIFLMDTMELRDTYIEQKLKEEIPEIK